MDPASPVDGNEVSGDATALELRRKILSNLNMDPARAKDPGKFWESIAHRVGRGGTGLHIEVAQEVFDVIGESWTDDCELEGVATVACYETLASHIAENLESGGTAFKVDKTGDEDDDDGGNRIARFGKINTNRTTTNVGTLLYEIEQKSLILDPPWQREYVWKSSKKQRLIESVFLNIPVPTILLYEDSEGTRHIIDGRQRLETLYRFRSAPKLKLRFKTPGKTIEGWRTGEPLHDAAGKYFDNLPEHRKKRFLTYEIQTVTFTDLPKSSLYEIFKRYNTGAETLKAQEIRNAVFQDSALHQMIYRMAGEHDDSSKYDDARERLAGEELRTTMGNKKQRYGAYNFVGRVIAFMHGSGGTVATAINDFMEQWEQRGRRQSQLEQYRSEYLDAYDAVTRWYDEPFCTRREGKRQFHELIGTIQMATAHFALQEIRAGRLTEAQVEQTIRDWWEPFVYGTLVDPNATHGDADRQGGVLQEKQNTSTHWGKQEEWRDYLLGTRKPFFGAPANVA